MPAKLAHTILTDVYGPGPKGRTCGECADPPLTRHYARSPGCRMVPYTAGEPDQLWDPAWPACARFKPRPTPAKEPAARSNSVGETNALDR